MANSERRQRKNLRTEGGYTKQQVKQARKYYRSREGLIANTESEMDKNKKGIKKREKKIVKSALKDRSKFAWINKRRAKSRKKWHSEIHARKQKNQAIDSVKAQAEIEMDSFENAQRPVTPPTPVTNLQPPDLGEESESGPSEGEELSLPELESSDGDETDDTTVPVNQPPVNQPPVPMVNVNPSRLELAELNLGAELSVTNRKRVIRQSIHIATNLAKIAGSIVQIAAGVGAPAGVAVKAAAAGIDISLPFFRSLKQFGRNKAGKTKAHGKKSVFTKVFNSNKSDVAKMAHRKKQAVTILMLVANLNNLMPTSTSKPARDKERKKLRQRAQEVERFMFAAGVSPKKLYRANGKPTEQVTMLVQAMCKRELF